MNFKTILMKMIPSLGKRALLAEVDQIKDKLVRFSIPAVQNTAEWMDKRPKNLPFSADYLFYQEALNKDVAKGKPLDTITKVLNNIPPVLEYLDAQIDVKYQEDITRESLKAFGLSMIKLLDAINFASDYSRLLAIRLLDEDLSIIAEKADAVRENILSPADVAFLKEKRYEYIRIIAILAKPHKQIIAQLESIPDVNATADNLDATTSTVGAAKMDPLQLNYISPSINPIFFVGKAVMRYQASKYKQAEVELKEVQLKILHLKQLAAGKSDAKLEKQIEYWSNLAKRLKAEIEEKEAEYEID